MPGGLPRRRILSDDRFDERLETFELYAHGGLEVLRGCSPLADAADRPDKGAAYGSAPPRGAGVHGQKAAGPTPGLPVNGRWPGQAWAP